jgi:hypothetical protein
MMIVEAFKDSGGQPQRPFCLPGGFSTMQRATSVREHKDITNRPAFTITNDDA